MRCLMSAKYNMTADVLRQNSSTAPVIDISPGTPGGQYVDQQDPISGDIVRVWEIIPTVPDDPETPENELVSSTIKCLARGITNTAQGTGGSGETFSPEYNSEDFVNLYLPPDVILSKRDRITNIRGSNGEILWVEEELEPDEETHQFTATIFNVRAVTPIVGPFGDHIENRALLEKAEFDV